MELNIESFVGQQALKAEFRSRISLASASGGPIPHVLLCGPAEMGKITFARAVACEMGAAVRLSDSPILTRLDLIGILSNTRTNEVVVIPEIDLLKNDPLEQLVEAVHGQYLRESKRWFRNGQGFDSRAKNTSCSAVRERSRSRTS